MATGKQLTDLEIFTSWLEREGLPVEVVEDYNSYKQGFYKNKDTGATGYLVFGTGGCGEVGFREDGSFAEFSAGYY